MENQTTPIVPPETAKTETRIAKPKKSLLIGMTVLVLILLASTGYLADQNIRLRKQIAQISASPSPTSTPDPTANWKIYSNTQFGFSFKYPGNLSIQEAQYSVYEVIVRDKNQVPSLDILISSKAAVSSDQGFTLQETKTIGDISWQAYYSPKIEGGNDPSKNADEYQLRLNHGNYQIVLRFYGQKQLSNTQDQILSTFKFLEATPSATLTP